MNETELPEHYTRFVALFAHCEREVRAFVRSLLPTWRDVDDVMQEVGLACWSKFDRFEGGESREQFVRWACVVARFEALRHRRNMARDRLVLSEDVIQLLADDAEARLATAEAERHAVEQCLAKLDEPERRLVMSVHTPGDSVARIAGELGQKARRLYSKVESLRSRLAECIRERVLSEEA